MCLLIVKALYTILITLGAIFRKKFSSHVCDSRKPKKGCLPGDYW